MNSIYQESLHYLPTLTIVKPVKTFKNYKKFIGKSILSVDFGEKVIGLASFKPGVDPYPLTRGRIINKSLSQVIEELSTVIDEDFTEVLIFGIPYLLDGQETSKTKEMKNIFSIIEKQFPSLQCYEQDETLSTKTAKDRMLNSPEYNFKVDLKKLDEVSAVIILEDFIRNDAY